jgi:hypothetical protein
MSPAGIPMFYGASNVATAIAETARVGHDVASIGRFEPVRELWVVDLAQVPEIPSLFDEQRRGMRASLRFLHGFVRDLTRPVSRNGAEHIDYVPTQIVTEYLRYLFRFDENESVDGLVFTSSRDSSGECFVLFAEREHCIEADADPPRGIALRLTDVQLRQL